MKNNKVKKIVLSLGLSLTAFSAAISGFAIKETQQAVLASADSSGYYSGISNTATGTTLLSSLRSLNGSKKTRSVGYGSMGTTASGSFKYTDYDPDSVKTDSSGQPYGTKILSFYSGTKCTSFNREHTWPQSHGGTTIESDIHVIRPTVPSENGSRGNSFYVEGSKSSSAGWDPAMESWGDETYRGDSARIIFYCVVANSQFGLLDVDYHDTSNANPDYKMGKLSTLLKWNLEYPVTQREQNRNAGAEYLQGNRNPFIDHPEYACKIWGDTNTTTKAICAKAVGPKTVSVSPKSASVGVGSKVTLTATTDNGSSAVLWKSSNTSVATVDDNGVVTGVSQGSATITVYSSYDANIKATATVTVKGINSISISGNPTKTQYYEGDEFNPSGLTVTATYADSTTGVVQNDACKWYDGTNNSSLKLVKGSTSVKCVLGSASATYTGITVLERQVSNEYTLLTSTADLVDGNKIIFAYNQTNAVAGSFAGGKYLSSKTATFSSDKNTITNIGDAREFTINKDGNAWKLTSSDGVLGAAALKTLAYNGGTTTWNIKPNSDGTTTVSSTNSSFGAIQYNTSTDTLRFMNYGSQGADTPIRPIQVYVKGQIGGGEDTPPVTYDGTVTGVSLSKSEANLHVGEVTTLTATVTGTGNYNPSVTWVSTDTSVVEVDNKGSITAKGVGFARVKAISSDPNIYATCVCYISNAQSGGSGDYTLVTSDSQLENGSKVIFAYNDTSKVAGSFSSKYLKSETAVFSSDKKTISDIKNAEEFTLSKSGGSWKFTSDSGVLGAAKVKELSMTTGTDTWNITVSSSGVSKVSSTNSSYGSLMYNTSQDSPRFLNYAAQGADSPVKDIQLYVKGEGGGEIIEASLSIDGENELSLLSGATGSLTYTYTGDADKVTDVIWSSSDEDVFAINSNGTYEALEAGTSTVFIYMYTSDGAGFYYDSISVTVSENKETSLNAVRGFIEDYMHLTDYTESLGWCKDTEHHYYADAKDAFNNLSAYQRELFFAEQEFSDASARLTAWATANGDTIDASSNSIIRRKAEVSNTNSTSMTMVAIFVTSILSALAAYVLFVKKGKRYEE